MRLNVSPTVLVEQVGKTLDNLADIECNFFETSDDVPDPRNLSMEKKNLMVFDDLMLEKQNKCETYYIIFVGDIVIRTVSTRCPEKSGPPKQTCQTL